MIRINFILIVTTFLILSSCQIFDDGTNSIITEKLSPNKRLKLIVFEKTGNATTDSSIHASIIPSQTKLNNKHKGNIFIADEFHKTNYSRDSFLLIKWIDDSTIEINYPSLVRLFKIEEYLNMENEEIKIMHKSRKEY